MIRQRLLPMLIGVAVLAGCATDGTGASTDTPRAAVSGNIYVQADAALAARQPEKAIALLKSASVAHPVDKKPWVRMAQIRFDASQYGEAISHAQEALARDPNDTLAYSILAVSGLRVASKALADLTGVQWFNGLGESVSLVTGLIFIVCVLAFRRGVVGEAIALFDKLRAGSPK